MENTIEQYKQLIDFWYKKDESGIDVMIVFEELLPLKLFLLGKAIEARVILQKTNLENIENKKRVFYLEAMLYDMPYYQINEKTLELAKEIITTFDPAYYANYCLSLYWHQQKDYQRSKTLIEKMLLITPNNKKIFSLCVYLSLLLGNNQDVQKQINQLTTGNKISAFLGVTLLSTTIRKKFLLLLLALLAIIFPILLYVYPFIIALLFGCYLLSGKKHVLFEFVIINLGKFTLLAFIIGIIINFVK